MTEQEDKCPLCGAQMLSLACPGGCFTATAHEVDGLACKDRQRAREAAKAAVPAEPADENQNFAAKYREAQKEIDRLTKLVAALHDDVLALRVGAEAADLGQDCDTAIRWYRQAVLKAGKKD